MHCDQGCFLTSEKLTYWKYMVFIWQRQYYYTNHNLCHLWHYIMGLLILMQQCVSSILLLYPGEVELVWTTLQAYCMFLYNIILKEAAAIRVQKQYELAENGNSQVKHMYHKIILNYSTWVYSTTAFTSLYSSVVLTLYDDMIFFIFFYFLQQPHFPTGINTIMIAQ